MTEREERDEESDSAEGAPAPLTAFGLPARPLGCGALGGLFFAAILAPGFLFAPGPEAEAGLPGGGAMVRVGAAGWAVAAVLALAFGAATAALVAQRRAAAAARRPIRPPLWVAFTALLIFGLAAAGLLGPLLLLALITGGG